MTYCIQMCLRDWQFKFSFGLCFSSEPEFFYTRNKKLYGFFTSKIYYFFTLKFDQITVRSNYSSLHYPRQLIFSMQFGDRKWLFLKLILYACISNMIALTNFLFLPLTYSMNTITLYYCNICITQFDLCYKI